MEARQKIIPKANRTTIFAIIIWVLVTGIVRKFLNVSLSRSREGGADKKLDWLCSQTKVLSVLPRTHLSK